jgi:anaphase-promoting complex subunit 10
VRLIDFEDPIGWFKISLEERNMKGEIIKYIKHKVRPYLKSMGIQICILQNIHNGRDTHIRQIKVFSPREHRSYDFNFPKFESNEFKQYMYIR